MRYSGFFDAAREPTQNSCICIPERPWGVSIASFLLALLVHPCSSAVSTPSPFWQGDSHVVSSGSSVAILRCQLE